MPGRNEPCHCGSGRKFKRCCEPSIALLDAAERLLARVSEHCRHEHAATCEAALSAFYEGAPRRFGLMGPTATELRQAERWYLLDGVEPGEPPALECLREEADSPAFAALERSRLRLVRMGQDSPPRAAKDALADAEVRVLLSSRAGSEAVPGTLVVARCVPLQAGMTGVLSGMVAVAPEVEGDLLALARSRDPQAGDEAGERALGAELARAAANWPEERMHTVEGDEVEDQVLAVEALDFDAACARLAAHPRLVVVPEDERDEPDVESWTMLPAASPVRAAPPVVPGVRWELADDEELDPPPLAGVQLDPYDGQLWVFAATPRRMDEAERELRGLLRNLLGETVVRTAESSRTPRWHALRMDRIERYWQRRIAAEGHLRAA